MEIKKASRVIPWRVACMARIHSHTKSKMFYFDCVPRYSCARLLGTNRREDQEISYKSFSGKTWDEVKELLCIRGIIGGDIIPQVEIPQATKVIENILMNWSNISSKMDFPGSE
jgi:hypothetical protein